MSRPRTTPAQALVPLVLAVLLAGGGAPAGAKPPYKHALKKHYGRFLSARLHQCTTCHLAESEMPAGEAYDPEAPPHNAFGLRLRELGETLESQGARHDLASRLAAVAAEDTDQDGVANEQEIFAGRKPGSAADVPSADELAAGEANRQHWLSERSDYAWEPFRPVVRPPVPTDVGSEWVRNSVDAFVAAEHGRRGLAPRAEAPREVLLRRVYLDLIGLPPSREELHAYLQDTAPGAYERVVERLLVDPRHAERWARHWMDVWRYSDWAGWTDGKQIRDSQPHIWRWRDWIIESLEADKPYDQMVQEMLAGDELAPADRDMLRATGFLARNYKMLSRETWLQETVEHTSKALLGLTLNCARCHDHMYDPIAQEEYYRFRAVFEPHQVRLERLPGQPDTSVDGLAMAYDADLSAPTYLFHRGDERQPDQEHPLTCGVPELLSEVPLAVEPVSLPPEVYYPGLRGYVRAESLAAARTRVTQAEAALAALTGATPAAGEALRAAECELAAARSAQMALEVRIAADDARYASPPSPVAVEWALAAARAERLAAHDQAQLGVAQAEHVASEAQAAGGSQPNEAAQKQLAEAQQKLDAARQALAAAAATLAQASDQYTPLTPVYPAQSSGRRLALARWLTDRRNPLLARVAVNHVWLRHFGHGLVESTFDFGQNGKAPSHPALLDWLAAEWMEPRVACGPEEAAPGGDRPAAAWSFRHLHRLLVTSATYRQSSLTDETARVQDPDNRYLTRAATRRMEAEVVRDSVLHLAGRLDFARGGAEQDHHEGLKVYRRSLYFRHAAEKQMTFLKLFDAASVTECYERKTSIVPQQALALANSELVIQMSRALARKGSAQSWVEPAEFAGVVFEQLLSRAARTDELAECAQFLRDQTAWFVAHPDGAASDNAQDVTRPARDAALRARENLVHVLFNHHDFVTIH